MSVLSPSACVTTRRYRRILTCTECNEARVLKLSGGEVEFLMTNHLMKVNFPHIRVGKVVTLH